MLPNTSTSFSRSQSRHLEGSGVKKQNNRAAPASHSVNNASSAAIHTKSATDGQQEQQDNQSNISSITAADIVMPISKCKFNFIENPIKAQHSACAALAGCITQYDFEERLKIYDHLRLRNNEISTLEGFHESDLQADYQCYLSDLITAYAVSFMPGQDPTLSLTDFQALGNALGLNLRIVDALGSTVSQGAMQQKIISAQENHSCFGNSFCDALAIGANIYQPILNPNTKNNTSTNTEPDYLLNIDSDIAAKHEQLQHTYLTLKDTLRDIYLKTYSNKQEIIPNCFQQIAQNIKTAGSQDKAKDYYDNALHQLRQAAEQVLALLKTDLTPRHTGLPLAIVQYDASQNGSPIFKAADIHALQADAHAQQQTTAIARYTAQARTHLQRRQTLEHIQNRLLKATKPSEQGNQFARNLIKNHFAAELPNMRRRVQDHLVQLLNQIRQGCDISGLYNFLYDNTWHENEIALNAFTHELKQHHLCAQPDTATKLDSYLYEAQNKSDPIDKPLTYLIEEYRQTNADKPGIDQEANDIAQAITDIRAGNTASNSPYPIPLLIKLCEKIQSRPSPKGVRIRDAQLLSVLSLLGRDNAGSKPTKGRLAEIKTGEGKSLTTVMVAIARVNRGETVDIITSSKTLAARDAKEFEDLYAAFGITASCNSENQNQALEGEKPCYKGNKVVVYGDAASFSADTLRDEFFGYNTFGGRRATTALVDEVDSVVLDRPNWLCQISEPIAGMSTCTPILYCIWKTVVEGITAKQNALQAQTAPNSAQHNNKSANQENKGDTTQQAPLFSDAEDIERFIKTTAENLQANIAPFFANNDATDNAAASDTYFIPPHLKPFVDRRLKHWVRSALNAAICYRQDRQYDANKDLQKITPIDYANTGEWEGDVQWENGLHQFLQMAHNFPVSSESLTSAFMSNHTLLSRYENLCGMSGTLGAADEAHCVQALFDVSTVKLPTFRRGQFQEREGLIATGKTAEARHSEWLSLIHQDIIHDGPSDATDLGAAPTSRARATLVICKTIEDVNQIADYLKTQNIPPSDIVTYTKGDDDTADIAAVHPGKIIVATNLSGRGTDIDASAVASAGGLHVILSFLPDNDRVQQQAFGRTARKGGPGSGRLIFKADELRSHHITTDNKGEPTLAVIPGRNAYEQQRLINLANRRGEFETKAQLFTKFQTYYHGLKDRLKLKPHHTAIEGDLIKLYGKYLLDEWALFLDAINNDRANTDIDAFFQTLPTTFEGVAQRNSFYGIQYANLLLNINSTSTDATHKKEALTEARRYYGQVTEKDGIGAAFSAYNDTYAILAQNPSHIEDAKTQLLLAKTRFEHALEKEKALLRLQFPECDNINDALNYPNNSENAESQLPTTPFFRAIQTMLYSVEDQLKKIDTLRKDYRRLTVQFSDPADLIEDSVGNSTKSSSEKQKSEAVRAAQIPRDILDECMRLGLKGPLLIGGEGDQLAAIISAIVCALVAVASIAAIIATGGAAAMLIGGAVLGAAMQGGINAVKGAVNGDFSLNQFGKEVALGAITGALTAGVAGGLGSAFTRFATHTALAIRTGTQAAIGTTAGAVGGIANYGGECLIKGEKWQTEEALQAGGKGALAGLLTGSLSGITNLPPHAIAGQMGTTLMGEAAADAALQGIELAQGRLQQFDGWRMLESCISSALVAGGLAVSSKQVARRHAMTDTPANEQASRVSQVMPLDQEASRAQMAESVRQRFLDKALPELEWDRRQIRSDANPNRHPEFQTNNFNRRASVDGHLGLQSSWRYLPGMSFENAPPKGSKIKNNNRSHPYAKPDANNAANNIPTPKRAGFKRITSLTDAIRKRVGQYLDPTKTLGAQNMDRTHHLSYTDIRDTVLNVQDQNQLYRITDLINALPYHDPAGKDFQGANKAFTSFKQAMQDQPGINRQRNIIEAGWKLIAELNSCVGNLSAGPKAKNIEISSRFDPGIQEWNDQNASLSPNTKQILRGAMNSDFQVTPAKIEAGRLHASHGYAKAVPLSNFSPESTGIMAGLGWIPVPELSLPPAIMPVSSTPLSLGSPDMTFNLESGLN